MKNILNIFLVLGIIALIVSLIVKPTRETAPQTSGTIESTMKPSPSSKSLAKPELIINAKKTYSVTLQTTEGEIDILLDTKNTPQTANNFYYLAKSGFYDNVIFHRVIPGFMIQGGDPTGTGTGGPGYKFEDEKFVGEYTRGTVAMANSGPNTNGSQFFIMHADTSLPPNYTIFGTVTKGLEVVDKIATAKTIEDGLENSTPVTPTVITKAIVQEK